MPILSFQDIINLTEYLYSIDKSSRSQPYVLVLYRESKVKPSQVFVILERKAVPQPSLLKAVDLCYKSYYVFDLDYQPSCNVVWQFLQSMVYNQPGQPHNDCPALRSFRAYYHATKHE